MGGFAYSDGLETATSNGTIADAAGLRAWLEVTLDETIGRMEGPVVWQAWRACEAEDFDGLIRLDEELTAMRPSSSARRSSRAMGLRLLTTCRALHPDARLAQIADLARNGAGPFDSRAPDRSLRAGPFDSRDADRSLRAGVFGSRNVDCSLRAGLALPVAFAGACVAAGIGRAHPWKRSPTRVWPRRFPRRCG